ncbi:MAG: hypothetical protein M3R02_26410, partial [Chloroflexota bacterium]|nr:hypothetical protein [Chloroflexota bacterium]
TRATAVFLPLHYRPGAPSPAAQKHHRPQRASHGALRLATRFVSLFSVVVKPLASGSALFW